MLTEYIEEALKTARYEIIEDEGPYYGEIDKLKGVWATGKTLEGCREEPFNKIYAKLIVYSSLMENVVAIIENKSCNKR